MTKAKLLEIADGLQRAHEGHSNEGPTYFSEGAEVLRALAAAPAQTWNIEAAAKEMARCMDYPWEHMAETGRSEMRRHAQSVIAAAIAAQQGGKQ